MIQKDREFVDKLATFVETGGFQFQGTPEFDEDADAADDAAYEPDEPDEDFAVP